MGPLQIGNSTAIATTGSLLSYIAHDARVTRLFIGRSPLFAARRRTIDGMASRPGQYDHVPMGNASRYAYRIGHDARDTSMILTRIAAVVRDTVYIDGGYLWWEPGMADGTHGPAVSDGTEKPEFPFGMAV
jgi:hypothetical protein